MTDFIYDIECYLDLFSVGITNSETGERFIFEVSDRINQSAQFIHFLYWMQANGHRAFGFNNEGYDWVVCQHLIETAAKNGGWFTHHDAYAKSKEIFAAQSRFGLTVWPDRRTVIQGDLMKIHHFDNFARATSLKKLEINMRSRKVIDLPYPPDQPTTDAQKDEIIAYMCHDVHESLRFYWASKDQIDFRDNLSETYPDMGDVLNMNDTKIGKQFFIRELINAGTQCYTYEGRKRVPVQTKRDIIHISDVISARVQFKHPEFVDTLSFLSSKSLTPSEVEADGSGGTVQTKGFFAKYDTIVWSNGSTTRYDPALTKEQIEWVKENGGVRLVSKSSNKGPKGKVACMVDNFLYDFGTGGIHGSLHDTTVREDDDWEIWDWDVASYYPNLAISNRFYPAHLSERFCDIYENVYQMRKQHAKGTAENAMLKLALNGVYGDSNNKYSPFYDPQYTMSITINGQLLLCMLAEWLTQADWGDRLEPNGFVKMIQINTDGLTVKVHKSMVDFMHETCKRWEEHTGLELESVRYREMHIRDVNSYIAVKTDGKIKRIGAYAYETPLDNIYTRERGWHQDHSMLVVRKAAEAQMVHGVPVRDFIHNHRDPYDFQLSVKVNKSANKKPCYLWHGDQKIQNNTRYYVSTDGAPLRKEMTKKNATEASFTGIQQGWNVTVTNDMDEFDWSTVNWLFYITEAEKLVI